MCVCVGLGAGWGVNLQYGAAEADVMVCQVPTLEMLATSKNASRWTWANAPHPRPWYRCVHLGSRINHTLLGLLWSCGTAGGRAPSSLFAPLLIGPPFVPKRLVCHQFCLPAAKYCVCLCSTAPGNGQPWNILIGSWEFIMVIAELVVFKIEFPAQQFPSFFLSFLLFLTDIVSNGRASGAKNEAGRAEVGKKKTENINAGTGPRNSCQCDLSATRHMAMFSISLRSKFNTCTTPSLTGPTNLSVFRQAEAWRQLGRIH